MPESQVVTRENASERLFTRIVVVSEPGRNGAAALACATALAATSSSQLTIVATAPQTATHCRSCGGVSPQAYNRAVCDEVAQDLHRVTTRLNLDADDMNLKLLIEGADLPLADWIAQGEFDLVLLPARRSGLHFRSHPTARLLRDITGADVHVVRAPGRHSPSRAKA
jgi:hypothetical protein